MNNELTLKDLFAVVLKKWRLLLACMLICGLLLGGYRLYSVSKTLPGAEETAKARKTHEQELEQFGRKQAGMELELEQLNEKLEHAYEYNENSLLLRVDPYHVTTGRLSFAIAIEAEVVSYGNEDGRMIGMLNMDDLMLKRIAGQYVVQGETASINSLMEGTEYEDYDERYLKELVSIDCNQQGIVTIEAYSVDNVDGLGVAEEMFRFLNKNQSTVASTTCEHELVLLGKTTSTVVDQNILNIQSTNEQQPAVLTDSIAAKQAELDGMTEPEEPKPASMLTAVKSGVKYGVLGVAVGLCIGAVLAFLLFTMNGRLQSAAQLTQGFKLRFLGSLEQGKPRRGLDALADRIAGESAPLPGDEAAALILANLNEFGKEAKRILLTGSLPQPRLEEAAALLNAGLNENGVTVLAGGSVLGHAETVRMLAEADAVILMEARRKSRLDDIGGQVARLRESEKEIIGVMIG